MLKKLKENKALKIIGNILYTISFILVLLILIVVLIQRFSDNNVAIAGIRIFNVATGSMEPKYNVGDVLISKEVDPSEIEIGDDITYEGEKGSFDGKIVTHQVIEKKEENGKYTFVTKGIANNEADPEISENQVYGKVIYKSVILSFISNITRNIYLFYFCIIVPMAIIIAKMIVDFLIRRQERKEEKEAEEEKNKQIIEEKSKEDNEDDKIEAKKVEKTKDNEEKVLIEKEKTEKKNKEITKKGKH